MENKKRSIPWRVSSRREDTGIKSSRRKGAWVTSRTTDTEICQVIAWYHDENYEEGREGRFLPKRRYARGRTRRSFSSKAEIRMRKDEKVVVFQSGDTHEEGREGHILPKRRYARGRTRRSYSSGTKIWLKRNKNKTSVDRTNSQTNGEQGYGRNQAGGRKLARWWRQRLTRNEPKADFEQREWTIVETPGTQPEPCEAVFGHCCMIPSLLNRYITVFKNGCNNDLFWDLSELTEGPWSEHKQVTKMTWWVWSGLPKQRLEILKPVFESGSAH